VSVTVDHENEKLNIQIGGIDDRIPESGDYPYCCVVAKSIQSHLKPTDLNF
jgi:hypothetical protein